MSDFDDIGRQLREQRPELSELELDHVKQRVRRRAFATPRKGQTMRSRLAILGMLVLGMLMSTTGAGLAIIAMLVFGMVLSTGGGALAVSGFTSQQGNAAQGQYQQGVDDEDDGDTGVLGEDEDSGPADDEAVQPARQAEAGAQATGGEQLPFTGFAAIPILLGGVALLASGLVLRKRAADDA